MKFATLTFFATLVMSETVSAQDSEVEPASISVSIVRVLANPEEFADKVITIAGYLNPTGNHLFLSKEHWTLDDMASAIYMCTDCNYGNNVEAENVRTGCEGQYVKITGLFVTTNCTGYDCRIGNYWMNNVYRIDRARDEDQPYWFHPDRICWTNPRFIGLKDSAE